VGREDLESIEKGLLSVQYSHLSRHPEPACDSTSRQYLVAVCYGLVLISCIRSEGEVKLLVR
jgi:hypothetical protein